MKVNDLSAYIRIILLSQLKIYSVFYHIFQNHSFRAHIYIYTYILELLHKNIINRKAFLKKKARKLKKKNKFARNKIVFKFYDVIGITFNPAITLLYENTR